jgi:hypothetical protein
MIGKALLAFILLAGAVIQAATPAEDAAATVVIRAMFLNFLDIENSLV